MSTGGSIIAIVAALVLVCGLFTTLTKDECIRIFRKLGQRHPYKRENIDGKKYYFSAMLPQEKGFGLYRGGVLAVTRDGFFIKHPLIFRFFLNTALIPWENIQIEEVGKLSRSVVLNFSGNSRIKFFCRSGAIKEIMKTKC